ncbi:hypothetical protein AVEN_178513-1 [Araneus ventricosus]|uniref:Uncharacterized protein n=1 Tax=Araneus ventricosus TaxID=182803 RepID=A0A4Y2CFE3_ARAVE|nr:hypothetical protein AVEN_178513-1 [Araneus ventricosus]
MPNTKLTGHWRALEPDGWYNFWHFIKSNIVAKFVQWVYNESGPTRKLTENDSIHEYSRKNESEGTKTAFVQISSTDRQQIPNNNSNSPFNTARRVSAYQLALETKLQRDLMTNALDFKHTRNARKVQTQSNTFTRLSNSGFLYLFRQDEESHRII